MEVARLEGVAGASNLFWAELHDGSKRLVTLNLTPGRTVYGERTLRFAGREYRVWDPYRSKLAAVLYKGLAYLPLREGDKVLYLGAATGTTASHVSDIVGADGAVYCVEFAQRAMRGFISNVCSARTNMIPILADAREPESYRALVEQVNLVYCDVAQPEQAKILAQNARMFLKPEGWGILAIKASSIDVSLEPAKVFKREIELLEEFGLKCEHSVSLEPYDRAHRMVFARLGG